MGGEAPLDGAETEAAPPIIAIYSYSIQNDELSNKIITSQNLFTYVKIE